MAEQQSNLLPHAVAFVTVAIWGSTFISTKVLMQHGLSPAHIFTIRFAIAYALMAVVSHKQLFASSLRDELTMLALGLAGGSAYFLTENYALRYSTATNVSLIVCSCPLFTALLFRLFTRGSRLSRRQWCGIVMAFIGMVTVVLNGHFVLNLSPIGDPLALAACLSWALYSLLMRNVSLRYGSAFLTRKVFFYGLVTILPYYAFFPDGLHASIMSDPTVVANLLFLGCIASMTCFFAWTWVIRRIGAVSATNYVYLNPLATVVFASWILGEQINMWFIAGALFILSGLYISNREKSKQ